MKIEITLSSAATFFITIFAILQSCHAWGSSPPSSIDYETMSLKNLVKLNTKIANLIERRVDSSKTLTIQELKARYNSEFPKYNTQNENVMPTPFIVACEKGRKKDVEFFIKQHNEEEAGMSVNSMINAEGFDSGGYKRICLHIAAVYERIDVVQYLLENNADVNVRDIHEHNVLHYAAYNARKIDTLKIILQHMKSSDAINHIDIDGYTPLDMAYEWNKDSPIFNDIVQLIHKHGGKTRQHNHIIPVGTIADAVGDKMEM